MAKRAFYIVDVFAIEKYTGNQLAVFRNGRVYSDDEMQKIAKEMNYSETTFVISDNQRNGGYDVRIFTPEKELPFAGHPTLGTAYVIQKEIIRKPVEGVILNLGVGQIPVTLEYKNGRVGRLVMKQKEPNFGVQFKKGEMADVLGVDESDIDERFSIEEVSTGAPSIIVPLKTLTAVKKAKTDRERYFNLIEGSEAKIILIFCRETYHKENHINVRVFADYFGVAEDPATGAANGCLAGYLIKHRFFDRDCIDIRAEQGHEIGRPSLLFLKAENKNGRIDVFVGGNVIMVAEGELR